MASPGGRRRRLVAVPILVITLMTIPVASAQPPILELTLSESEGLVDGQTIEVSGPGGSVLNRVGVCPADELFESNPTLFSACRSWADASADPLTYVVEGEGLTPLGAPGVNCWVTDCVVAKIGYDNVGGDPLRGPDIAAVAPVTFAPLFEADPTAALSEGTPVTVRLRNALPEAENATAFSMQCAFRTASPGGFFCGPTGDVVPYVGAAYDGSFVATTAFGDGAGGVLTCDVDAICVAVVAVLNADLSLVGGAGVPITFE